MSCETARFLKLVIFSAFIRLSTAACLEDMNNNYCQDPNNNGTGACYGPQYSTWCCATCAKQETGIPNCTYGDRAKWCGSVVANFQLCQDAYNRVTCCGTCWRLKPKSNVSESVLTQFVTQRNFNETAFAKPHFDETAFTAFITGKVVGITLGCSCAVLIIVLAFFAYRNRKRISCSKSSLSGVNILSCIRKVKRNDTASTTTTSTTTLQFEHHVIVNETFPPVPKPPERKAFAFEKDVPEPKGTQRRYNTLKSSRVSNFDKLRQLQRQISDGIYIHPVNYTELDTTECNSRVKSTTLNSSSYERFRSSYLNPEYLTQSSFSSIGSESNYQNLGEARTQNSAGFSVVYETLKSVRFVRNLKSTKSRNQVYETMDDFDNYSDSIRKKNANSLNRNKHYDTTLLF